MPEALRWVGDWVNVARSNQTLADFRKLCEAYAGNEAFYSAAADALRYEEYVSSRRDAEAMVGAGDA